MSNPKLPGQGSNLEWRNQNPQCYHYTTGQPENQQLIENRRFREVLDFASGIRHEKRFVACCIVEGELLGAALSYRKRDLFQLDGQIHPNMTDAGREVDGHRCKVDDSLDAGRHQLVGD